MESTVDISTGLSFSTCSIFENILLSEVLISKSAYSSFSLVTFSSSLHAEFHLNFYSIIASVNVCCATDTAIIWQVCFPIIIQVEWPKILA